MVRSLLGTPVGFRVNETLGTTFLDTVIGQFRVCKTVRFYLVVLASKRKFSMSMEPPSLEKQEPGTRI